MKISSAAAGSHSELGGETSASLLGTPPRESDLAQLAEKSMG